MCCKLQLNVVIKLVAVCLFLIYGYTVHIRHKPNKLRYSLTGLISRLTSEYNDCCVALNTTAGTNNTTKI